jgi:hypothetical protein
MRRFLERLNTPWTVLVALVLVLAVNGFLLYTNRSAQAASVVLVGAGYIASCSNNDEAIAKLFDGRFGTVFTSGDNAYQSGTTS